MPDPIAQLGLDTKDFKDALDAAGLDVERLTPQVKACDAAIKLLERNMRLAGTATAAQKAQLAGLNVTLKQLKGELKESTVEQRAFEKQLGLSGNTSSRFATTVKSAFAGLAGLFGVGLGVGGVLAFGKSLLDFGEEAHDSALKLREMPVELERTRAALSQFATKEDTTQALHTLVTTMIAAKNGSAEAGQSLKSLGITFEDLKTKTPSEALLIMADHVKNAKDKTEELRLLSVVFGNDLASILYPALVQGGDAIKNAGDAAQVAGNQMDDAANRGAKSLQRGIDEVKQSVLELIDAYTRIPDWIVDKYDPDEPLVGSALSSVGADDKAAGAAGKAAGAAGKAAIDALGTEALNTPTTQPEPGTTASRPPPPQPKPPLEPGAGDEPRPDYVDPLATELAHSKELQKIEQLRGPELEKQAATLEEQSKYLNQQLGYEGNQADLAQEQLKAQIESVEHQRSLNALQLAQYYLEQQIAGDQTVVLQNEIDGYTTLADIEKTRLDYETKIGPALASHNELLAQELILQEGIALQKKFSDLGYQTVADRRKERLAKRRLDIGTGRAAEQLRDLEDRERRTNPRALDEKEISDLEAKQKRAGGLTDDEESRLAKLKQNRQNYTNGLSDIDARRAETLRSARPDKGDGGGAPDDLQSSMLARLVGIEKNTKGLYSNR